MNTSGSLPSGLLLSHLHQQHVAVGAVQHTVGGGAEQIARTVEAVGADDDEVDAAGSLALGRKAGAGAAARRSRQDENRAVVEAGAQTIVLGRVELRPGPGLLDRP